MDLSTCCFISSLLARVEVFILSNIASCSDNPVLLAAFLKEVPVPLIEVLSLLYLEFIMLRPATMPISSLSAFLTFLSNSAFLLILALSPAANLAFQTFSYTALASLAAFLSSFSVLGVGAP